MNRSLVWPFAAWPAATSPSSWTRSIPPGACHNRMAVDGQWRDGAAVGDWWGRALWGLGVAAATRADAGHARPGARRVPDSGAVSFPARPVDDVRRAGRR